jgi:hypothetical protein
MTDEIFLALDKEFRFIIPIGSWIICEISYAESFIKNFS